MKKQRNIDSELIEFEPEKHMWKYKDKTQTKLENILQTKLAKEKISSDLYEIKNENPKRKGI